MTSTDELIRSLAQSARPSGRLRPPFWRSLLWLGAAAAFLALFAANHGLRPDLAQKMDEPLFFMQVAATALTAVMAAVAAFHLSLPDRSDWWMAAPLPPLLLWSATVSYGCLAHWSVLGPDRLTPHLTDECLPLVTSFSIPLLAAMMILLRHAATIRPGATLAMGTLAVAAAVAGTMTLLHDFDTSILALAWNFAMTGGLVLLAVLSRRGLFALVTARRG